MNLSREVVDYDKMVEFVVNSLISVGVAEDHAKVTAELLIEADLKGHYSHGVARLPFYIHDITNSLTEKHGLPSILKHKGGTAWVDGNNLLGAVVGKFCMEKAIELAQIHGLGMVTVKHSNHFGICSYYSEMASAAGLIGMAFTNTSPCAFHCNASERAIGSNPISFAAPAKGSDKFSLDMATTTVAYGKIEVVQRKGIDVIPHSWGANENGQESKSATEVLDKGGLMPLGGKMETGGYKGTGLAMMVEILCGVISGASFGKNIRQWQNDVTGSADLGQCFLVIDPECFAPCFSDRLQEYINETRNLETMSDTPIMVAGKFL
uniref:Malate/lactate/ureidoglycolate dehydrogenase, LDH2 family n=1 Tax=Rhabditophanes sp. KR3021 TaxID=114890 RepID=A0AC35TR52_9BILA